MIKKLLTNEHPEFYSKYINLLEEKDIIKILTEQEIEIENLFSHLTDEQLYYKYADGKWTMKEVLGHLIDSDGIAIPSGKNIWL